MATMTASPGARMVSGRRVKTELPAEFRSGSAPNNPLTTLLGLFSIGLGLAELLTPRRFAGAIGATSHPTLIRAYGLREIGAGVGLLASHDPTPWLWARVAGDALDLATLWSELKDADGDADRRQRLQAATAAVVGVTALDVIEAQNQTRKQG